MDAGAPGTQAAIHLGRAGVSRVLVDPEPAVIRETLRTLAGPEGRGRVAVCLAGGGIEGMLLVDGAFSRTTNMRVAVERGATLVLVLDPLVPVRIPRSGYVQERGGLYAASQGIKSLIHGRFDKAVNALRETFPGVSFHLFQPEGEAMRMLGGSPMKLFFREEVDEVAFESAVATIRRRLPELARDLGRHGIALADPATPHRPVLGSVPPPPLPPGLAIEPPITAGR